jgi:DNA primase
MEQTTMIDLSSFQIDVREVMDELRLHWTDNKGYDFNPTALSRLKPSGDHFMCCCPFHHEMNPSCGVKTEHPYPFQCFGCGMTGTLAALVTHVLDLPGELQGMQWLVREFISVSAQERTPLNIDDILDGREADKKRTLSDSEATKYTVQRHRYMYQRGFTDAAITRYELGYDEKLDAITLPVRNSKGQLRFIKRRSVSKKNFLNESGIYKKDILYGLWYILNSRRPIFEIYLNESETDTIACYEGRLPACSIMGRILFEEQVKELIKTNVKTVNLFFDNDPYGVVTTFNSYGLLSRLSPIRVNVVIYPGGHWGIDTIDPEQEMQYKDANDLLKANRLNEIKIVPYIDYLQMLKMKQEKFRDILRRNRQQ